ncbi:MAG: hypothetical protein JSW22_05495 [Chloroflexota bacterium]|nr:MAG: hypothetical protein JSW22_05495 [Chloroflexota bacterium]
MKRILNPRAKRYIRKIGPLLIVGVLIMGLASCDGGCSCAAGEYELTTSSTEGGDVIISGEGTYADGTIVTIEAVADECYEFVEWTGAGVADPYSPVTTITMDEAKSITAVFALLSYDLTVASTDGGAVTSPGEDTFTYDCGTEVPLVATAEEGYYFVNWSGDVDTIANVNGYTTTITIMADYSITANFALIPPGQFVLTTTSTDGGSVTTPGEASTPYDEGTVVDLVAEAEDCYEFVEWTGDVDTIADVDSASTNITMDADKSVIASFAPFSYDLTVDSTEGGQVNSPGEGTFPYDCGTVVNLVAEADLGSHFVEWTGDTSTIDDVDAAETTITISGNYSITANFGPFSGGNGTAEDPYQIADWYRLDDVRNYLNSHFILINDLGSNSIGYTELASTTAHNGTGWQPIAGNSTFMGSFDGQAYDICDLFIDRPDESNVGLFGVLSDAGTIENVGVNGNVTGQGNVGTLVGKNEGAVSNSYATGRVIGDNNVGGLVGLDFNGCTVTNSYATSNVTGVSNVGGLVGWNKNGTVSNSYATGRVVGTSNVGGLVGKNSAPGNIAATSNSYATGPVIGDDIVGGLVGKNDNTGSVSDSYSTGSVTASTNVGGLVGKGQPSDVTNSFWDTQTSGQGSSAGGTGKTTVEMQEFDTFSGVWDITTVANSSTRDTNYIWNIVDNVTYPFLSWQPV